VGLFINAHLLSFSWHLIFKLTILMASLSICFLRWTEGTDTVYFALASKAISRHFKCLRDGIAGQIQASKREPWVRKIPLHPAQLSRGETPRLRVLDQPLRQQWAFQQISMKESHPWRPQRGLPERSVSVLRAWL
jgi:hypothetical protein